MKALQVQHYIRRASDFLEGMRLMQADESYRSSSSLLAIHSAISFCDALRVGSGDAMVSADNHTEAMPSLKRLLPREILEDNGIANLSYLISWKTFVAYGNRSLDANAASILLLKAERFAKWANNTGKKLKIEGWQDDVD